MINMDIRMNIRGTNLALRWGASKIWGVSTRNRAKPRAKARCRLSRHSRARTLSLLELALCIRPVPQVQGMLQALQFAAGIVSHGKQGMVDGSETPAVG